MDSCLFHHHHNLELPRLFSQCESNKKEKNIVLCYLGD